VELDPKIVAYIRKRIGRGCTAAQLQIELQTRKVFVPFAVLLEFDPERKGAAELARRTALESRKAPL